MQIEPVVLLDWQREQRLLERTLHRAQHIAARPLLLGALLVLDAAQEKLALEQAAAAITLLRMNAPDHVWPLFQHQADPRLRSGLAVHRGRLAHQGLAPLGPVTDPESLLNA